MLQTSRPITTANGSGTNDGAMSFGDLLSKVVGLLRRQYPVMILAFAAIVGLACVYVFAETPKYTGRSILVVDSSKTTPFRAQQQQIVNAADLTMDTSGVDTQLEILKSENVALAVIKNLHLTDDPEFVGPGAGLLESIGDLIARVFGSDSDSDPAFRKLRKAYQRFDTRLKIERIGLTYAMEIKFQSTNPDLAARVSNGIADAYIADALQAKYETATRAASWLQDRISKLRDQASAAQRAVVDYKTKNNIVESSGQLLNEQQVTEYNTSLIQAKAQLAEARARLDRVNIIINNDKLDPSAIDTGTVSDTLKNDVITHLRQQYSDLANREAEWSRRYGPEHIANVNLRYQMAAIRRSIVDELKRIAETYKSDFQIAEARETSIQKGLDDLVKQSQSKNEAQVTLKTLESNAQSAQTLYDNFVQRYMESVQQQSFGITEARLITSATRPLRKSSPKTLLVLVIAAGGGLLISFAAGVLHDVSDDTFRTARQVEDSLQTPCLALAPLYNSPKPAIKVRRSKKDEQAAAERRQIIREPGVYSAISEAPLSRFSEAIRAIKVGADIHRSAKANRVIGITSTLANEGKSTIAYSLAQLVAHGKARTILVDCDLRNPTLSHKIAPKARAGILEVLSGKTKFDETIWTDPETRLDFLPAVMRNRFSDTHEILASNELQVLFEALRNHYDEVIVDLSPLSPVVDVRAMAHLMDTFVLIVEWGRTRPAAVERALVETPAVYENLSGVVLNKADVAILKRYERYGNDYYANHYYDETHR